MHLSPRLLLDSLKRCPLCGAVNAEPSLACFVCGWAGEFDRDAADLQASFDDIVAKCPDLVALRSSRKPAPRWSVWLRRLTLARTRNV